jgi:hypothetical protein
MVWGIMYKGLPASQPYIRDSTARKKGRPIPEPLKKKLPGQLNTKSAFW